MSILAAAVAPIVAQVLGGRARAVPPEIRTRQSLGPGLGRRARRRRARKVAVDQVEATRLVLAAREALVSSGPYHRDALRSRRPVLLHSSPASSPRPRPRRRAPPRSRSERGRFRPPGSAQPWSHAVADAPSAPACRGPRARPPRGAATADIAASGSPRQSRRSDPCGRRSAAVAGSPVAGAPEPRGARRSCASCQASGQPRSPSSSRGPRRASGGHRHGGRPGSSAEQKLSGTVRYITQPAGPWRHPPDAKFAVNVPLGAAAVRLAAYKHGL